MCVYVSHPLDTLYPFLLLDERGEMIEYRLIKKTPLFK